jgi:hypothetical protein
MVTMSTTDQYMDAIDRAFRAWVEKNDPENKLKPIEQTKAFNAYIRELRGLPPKE